LGAGNKRGGLRIYHNYRRHLLKFIVASLAERTPPFATAKQLYKRRQKKKVTQKIIISRSRYRGESNLSVGPPAGFGYIGGWVSMGQKTAESAYIDTPTGTKKWSVNRYIDTPIKYKIPT